MAGIREQKDASTFHCGTRVANILSKISPRAALSAVTWSKRSDHSRNVS
jgi:hypothetical protein